MNQKTNIQQELEALGAKLPIAEMPNMDIPSQYFEDFSTSLMKKIEMDDSILSNLSSIHPYQIPSDYFETFPQLLIDEIHEEDFLQSLPKPTPYQVSAQYFDELPNEILSSIHKANQPSFSVHPSRRWIATLSLAATLLLFMGLAFKGFIATNSKVNNVQFEHELSKVSDSDIQLYLQQHAAEIDANLVNNSYDESTIDINKLESEVLDQTFNQISDEELKQYTF